MSGPIRVLIAALGGEGGGVLASWIADAAIADGFAAQRTSVPGVAQRTGGTTYYIEMVRAEGRRPVLALAPAPGEVDLFVSSELLESARIVNGGFVTPERTFVVSPVHRVYTVNEKIAMADGRADPEPLTRALKTLAKGHEIGDFAALAQSAACQLNAVLLGLAARHLPVSPGAFRAAIRADGRAIEANLRGFEAGLNFAADAPAPAKVAVEEVDEPAPAIDPVDAPESARAIIAEGVKRLEDFQDAKYARSYLDRLEKFRGRMDGESFAELARHLAVRMSSEDTVRVAQLKLRESRLASVRAEARARPGDIVHVTEYLKPGPEEIFSILPERPARAILGFIESRGWSNVALPMRVRTTGAWGFLRLRGLAALKFMRPNSLRATRERAWIDRWLSLVERALEKDPRAALEIIETAGLVKGYGDTWKNGEANWARIAEAVIEPMLAAEPSPPHFADAVLQARLAALADPEGKRLVAVIESIGALRAA